MAHSLFPLGLRRKEGNPSIDLKTRERQAVRIKLVGWAEDAGAEDGGHMSRRFDEA